MLRIDAAVLLGRGVEPAGVIELAAGVERIRAALSRYEVPLGRAAAGRPVLPAVQVARQVAHAWITFQHARYPRVAELLPELLADVERAHAADPVAGRVPLVGAYRITASLLVKLGAPELSLCGTLLVQAALAAACDGDAMAAADLLDEAAAMADRVGDGHDHHRTGFGPTAVEVARVAAAVEWGDSADAVARHEKATTRDGWRWLPTEHRAAHLLDAARAYLQAGDPIGAGRALMEADRIAPAEIRHRPAGRDVLAQIARDPAAPTMLVHLAVTLGVG
ncbi:XRE family transcriptional regulator [Micromonospora carbonacea]|uniref:XRE family transcriptional regulator n=1 Tax=Micromonospora carbonacea TaxID=47853 RepID=UPI0037238B15